jgi:hypothetical protein
MVGQIHAARFLAFVCRLSHEPCTSGSGTSAPISAGCFCFLNPPGQPAGGGLPLFGTLTIDGFPLYRPRCLSKRLNRTGPVAAAQIAVLAEALAALFPSAA